MTAAVVPLVGLVLLAGLIAGWQPPVEGQALSLQFATNTPRATVDCTINGAPCASVRDALLARDMAVPQGISFVTATAYPTSYPTATITPTARPELVRIWTCYEYAQGVMECVGR